MNKPAARPPAAAPAPPGRSAEAPLSSTHRSSDERPGGTALLVVDMISSWDFEDAAPLARQALRIVDAIARLQRRCRRAGVPVIYANDNRGRWRSDLRQQVAQALASEGPGAPITAVLQPGPEDYFVLKPLHSAFFGTPLHLLLLQLQLRRLVLVGVSSDQCILATAQDARMRDFEVVVPRDCVASQTAARTRASVRHYGEVMKIPTPLSSRLRLR
jgi:nicotinamidase-related amidase